MRADPIGTKLLNHCTFFGIFCWLKLKNNLINDSYVISFITARHKRHEFCGKHIMCFTTDNDRYISWCLTNHGTRIGHVSVKCWWWILLSDFLWFFAGRATNGIYMFLLQSVLKGPMKYWKANTKVDSVNIYVGISLLFSHLQRR